MAQPNLETLFQHLGPNAASLYAGQQAAESRNTQNLADQTSQAALEKSQQERQQSSLMNPLLVQQQQNLNNKGTLENQFATDTQSSKIQGENATNMGKIGAEQEKNATRALNAVNQFSSQIESIPPLQRGLAVQQFMQENDIKPNGTIGTMLTATPNY